MTYDYSMLKERITDRFGSAAAFANEIGISERDVSRKLNNECSWKQSEIEKAADALDIWEPYIQRYFFSVV